MKKILAAGVISSLAVLVLGAWGPAVAQTTPTGKAAAIVEPSVVYLEQHWTARVWVPATIANGIRYTKGYLGEAFTFSTRCTGFVISPDGYVATAGHCVDPSKDNGGASQFAILNYGIYQWLDLVGWEATADNYNEALEGLDPLGNWRVEGASKGTAPQLEVVVQHGVAAGGVSTGEAMSARVIDHKSLSGGDVALLKVESPNQLPAVSLADADTVDVGTEVISVGYPGAADEVTDASYEPTFQDGQINSVKTREGGQLPVWEISSDMTGGMSGGPTVDTQGRVLGINSYGHVEESYNFISPVSLLNEMLAQNGVEARLGENDRAYREGLNAFFAGDYDRAAFEFERVTQLQPGHVQAQDYLRRARSQGGDPEKGDPANQGGMIMWIAIGAGVLLLLGGLLWFLLSRRKKAAPAPASAGMAAAPAPGAAPTPAAGMAAPTTGMPPAPPPPAPTPVSMPVQPTGEAPEANGEAAPAARPRRTSTTTAKKSTARKTTAKSTAAKRTGARAAANRVSGKFCPDCGGKALAAAKFCENCGHKF